MIVLFFVFFSFAMASEVKVRCYESDDCVGSSVKHFIVQSGVCQNDSQFDSYIFDCSADGDVIWTFYNDGVCSKKSGDSIIGSGCTNTGLEYLASCDLSGCVNIVGITVGILVPLFICVCCIVLLPYVIVLALVLFAGALALIIGVIVITLIVVATLITLLKPPQGNYKTIHETIQEEKNDSIQDL